MAKNNQMSDKNKAVIAGATGLVVGAAAAATAFALSDEENRKKLAKKADEVKDAMKTKWEETKAKANQAKGKVEQKAMEVQEDLIEEESEDL